MVLELDFGLIISWPQLSVILFQLYELAVNKQEIVEVWDHSNDRGSRNLKFVRAFNNWELDPFVNFSSVL